MDGRSDVFSLGAVLYQLLTGSVPFPARTEREMLTLIATTDARPLRQHNSNIPKPLEQICLKALSRRATDRYITALDFSSDLRAFQAEWTPTAPSELQVSSKPSLLDSSFFQFPNRDSVSGESGLRVAVVPRGLRCFESSDQDFFVTLVPGPCGQDGVPAAIRFWLDRIEPQQTKRSFPLGLLYGPSGCGKSSLVRAGILPRLSSNVLDLLIEATSDQLESQLLARLHNEIPDLPTEANLAETFREIRLRGLPEGRRLLIVIDQFEQWLHAHPHVSQEPLVAALRHCDGEHLQCLFLVRDDFWMGVTRFMQELEVNLVPDRNVMSADLFDLRHARKVLTAIGQAYNALPQGELSKSNRDFVDAAVTNLAENDRIVCVRLALFSEMIRNKPWEPSTLKDVGGTDGIGVRYLEESFSGRSANPQHRFHEAAARSVLTILLPKSGSNLKGHSRSRDELLQASGYARTPELFSDLLRILDGELRLLTPVDVSAKEDQENCRHYQLSHDFLVPALRLWLTRKQRESLRGRAELCLKDRAELWLARSERRHLPSLVEDLRIRLLTKSAKWTSTERDMMQASARYHIKFSLAVLVLLIVGIYTGWVAQRRTRHERNSIQAQTLISSLKTARLGTVPA
ncbi:MAG: hypothetical protein KDA84_02430, partial [Planctomycetaceae bacterium]|nr:hypothetical protein [Planctomycetaceae bacterium]